MNDWSDILIEEWRAIPGYEGYYEAKQHGGNTKFAKMDSEKR